MPALHRDRNLQLIFGVTLMVVLGVSSIIPVLHGMMDGLGINERQVGLVITVFTLPGVLLAPVAGALADRYGRKAVLVPSLVLFGVMGPACALAPDFHTLLALRFIQGIGAAPLGILASTLIGDLFQGPQLAEAMGYNASVLAMGTAAYPALGGLLGFLGWRLPFVLHLAAVPLALVIARRMRLPAVARPDMRGYFRAALGRMRSRTILGLYAAVFGTFILLYGPLVTFYPILLGRDFGASPMIIGLLISAASLFSGVAASQLGRLSRAVSEHLLIRAGYVLYALCFALTPLVRERLWFLLPLCLFGLAQGLTMPSMVTMLNRLAPDEYRGGFMAVYGLLLRLGQTLAPLLMGLVAAGLGIRAVFWTAAALALAMLGVAAAMVGPVPASPAFEPASGAQPTGMVD